MSPRPSRRKSASVVRASTRPRRLVPFTVSATSCSDTTGLLDRRVERGLHQMRGDTLADTTPVACTSATVSSSAAPASAAPFTVSAAAGCPVIAASVDVAAHRRGAHPEQADGAARDAIVVVELDGGHHAREREVAAAARHLAEAEADPAVPHREPRRNEHLVVGQRGRPRAGEELAPPRSRAHRSARPPRTSRRARARPPAAPTPDRRARATRRPCRGCGSGSGRCTGSPGRAAGPTRRPRGSCSATACGVAAAIRSEPFAPGDALQLPDPGDVDEVLEPGEAQGEHRHEALTAREHLGVVAVLAQQRDHVGHRLGRVIVERRRVSRPGT